MLLHNGGGHLTVHKLDCLGAKTVIINTTTAESINILNTVSTSTRLSIFQPRSCFHLRIVHLKRKILVYDCTCIYTSIASPPPHPIQWKTMGTTNCLVTSHCLHLLCELQTQKTGPASAGPRRTEAASAGPRKTEATAAGPRRTEATAAGPRRTEATAAGQKRKTEATAAGPRRTEATAAGPRRKTEAASAGPRRTEAGLVDRRGRLRLRLLDRRGRPRRRLLDRGGLRLGWW